MRMETAITIQLDGRPRELPAGCTLAELIAALDQTPNAVATAVNGQFVARTRRPALRLQDGDHVLLFRPIVGG